MKRIKVINEPTELVPVMRAMDTDVKRKVFMEVSSRWCTANNIEELYGKEGRQALNFFEKMKLVETRWESVDSISEKAYHTYYLSFHINTTVKVQDIAEVLAAVVMADEDFEGLEDNIIEQVKDGGRFAGDIAEDLGISQIMLRSLVKRSTKLDYRGHRVEISE
ncbi:MAG: ArsR family transcriptional regulator [Thermoplasmata archaeon]|nr:MAG: ArsR family transcriptional regulator [Thermoplasmata archaeon]